MEKRFSIYVENLSSESAFMIFHFSFARTKEKRNKKKIRRLHFLPTPMLFQLRLEYAFSASKIRFIRYNT